MLETGIAKAVRLAGSQSALGRLIQVTAQCVQRWVAQGHPSPEGCKKIEIGFGGRLTRAELDPDLFGPICHAG